MGMLYFIEDEKLKERVFNVYKKLHMPALPSFDKEKVYQLLCKDKKANGDTITIVKVKECGKAVLEDMHLEDIKKYL